MIEKETKIVTTQKEEESVVRAACDFCSKELPIEKVTYWNCEKDSMRLGKHVSLMTSHRDWGNDSVDSLDHFQFCSMKCCLDWIAKNESKLYSHTREFEIECHGVY